MQTDWYRSLSQREQITLWIGGSITLGLIVFQLLWKPIALQNEELHRQVQSKQKLLHWMQAASETVDQSKTTHTEPRYQGSTRQIVTQIAGNTGVHLNRVQRNSQKKLRLNIERTKFSQLLKLLDETAKAGIVISSANIKADKNRGYVSSQLVVSDS